MENTYGLDLKDFFKYIEKEIRDHLRYISWPTEKLPITVWVGYLSYLAMQISVIIAIMSFFLFPSGVWQLFVALFLTFTVVCLSIILTYEPR